MAPPKLIAGPYAPPRFRVGHDLAGAVASRTCLATGPHLVPGPHPVRGITDGPIAWPYAIIAGSRPQLIIVGDLERAIRTESVQAVAHWWGVSRWWVERVRRMLGVERMNAGTTQLWRDLREHRLGKSVRNGHGVRKLDDKQRRAIVRRRRRGESAAALGREFGVTRQYVEVLVSRADAAE